MALPSSNRSAIAKSKNHRFVVHVTKNEKGDEHRSRTRVNIQMFWHYQSLFSLCAFERHRSVVLVRVSLCGVFLLRERGARDFVNVSQHDQVQLPGRSTV